MNAYDTITQRIMEQLEKGTVPWQQPWHHTAGMPRNLLSQKEYRGINVWMLASVGYSSPYWLTYCQAQEIGGYVRKGEHGSPIVFWKWLERDEESQDGEEMGSQTRRVPMARLYTVFNIQQCELPERLQPFLQIDNALGADTHRQIEACKQIVASMPLRPAIQQREAQAYYRPAADTVNMPERRLFPKAEHYYSVLFHELTHSTGHASRLDRATLRDLLAFGDTNYSREELCAEMGAAYLCGVAGIGNETVTNSAAYIQGWLNKLRNDKKMLVQAAAQAQKAADFILGKGNE
jgi:antirestriction protein ArdC